MALSHALTYEPLTIGNYIVKHAMLRLYQAVS